jgi:hypothetical protein
MADNAKNASNVDWQATQDAALNVPVRPANENSPITKGADKEFNEWFAKTSLSGNPEQYSPMQVEQNARDANPGPVSPEPANRIDDVNDDATRKVAELRGEDQTEAYKK